MIIFVFQQTQPTINSNITLIFSDNWEFSLLVTRKKQTFFSFLTLSTCSVLWSSVTAGLMQRDHNTLLVCTLQVKIWLNFDLTYNQQQNCWDIVLKLGNVREQTNPQPLTLPFVQSWGVCCFLQVAWTAAQHCMEGMGEGQLYFPFFELAKHCRGPFKGSVPTKYVTDCRLTINFQCLRTIEYETGQN